MPWTAREAELLAWLKMQYRAMVEPLAQLVNTDSARQGTRYRASCGARRILTHRRRVIGA